MTWILQYEVSQKGLASYSKNKTTKDKSIFCLIDDIVKVCLLRETDLTFECAVALAQHSVASKWQVKAVSSNALPSWFLPFPVPSCFFLLKLSVMTFSKMTDPQEYLFV